MRIILALIALLAPAAAAASEVSLSSEVFVERTKTEADGRTVTVREAPGVVTPGDRLVFVLSYRNAAVEPATGFTVTNPVPAAVAYSGSESGGAVVSVDGGKSWGAIETLTVPAPDGTSRPARPGDVTHIRWTFEQPIAAGAAGTLSFRGTVK